MLEVSVGRCSQAGRDHVNQDAVGSCLPLADERRAKGVAVAIADGIGSSDVSGEAARAAVAAFLSDYYCTAASWSVKTAGQRVIAATNAWLHAQTLGSRYRQDMDRGYVCTLSALVAKGASAHLFHVGDTRISRLAGTSLEPLTTDHRVTVAGGSNHLARALGMGASVEIDYRRVALAVGDVYLLASDGVHTVVAGAEVAGAVAAHGADLDAAAEAIVAAAHARDAGDDASVVLLRIEAMDSVDAGDLAGRAERQRIPDELAPRQRFAGFEIVRCLATSARSRVYLARDPAQGDTAPVVIKTPGPDVADDPVLLERFLLEEWVARRIDNPHVLKALPPRPETEALHVAFEYVDGQGLDRWLVDHPKPDLARVRQLVTQIGRGLQAFHRQEMLHQDLRPANVLIDDTGTARIIDFGSVRVAGIAERGPAGAGEPVLGTHQFAAPEYFRGDQPTAAADQYSLGAMMYQMLTGDLPYGPQLARATSVAAQQRLAYRSLAGARPDVPDWVDAAIRKAVHIDPARRHVDVAAFVAALTHSPVERRPGGLRPLVERDPAAVWRGVSALLFAVIVALVCYIGLSD